MDIIPSLFFPKSTPVCVAVRNHVKHLTLYQLRHQPTAQELHGALTGLRHTCQQSLKTCRRVWTLILIKTDRNMVSLSLSLSVYASSPSCSHRCRVVWGGGAAVWAGSAGQHRPASGSPRATAGSHCCRCKPATDSGGLWTGSGPTLPEPASEETRIRPAEVWSTVKAQLAHFSVFKLNLSYACLSSHYFAMFLEIESTWKWVPLLLSMMALTLLISWPSQASRHTTSMRALP